MKSVVLVIVIFCNSALAGKDTIDRAGAFLLQKKRTSALELLAKQIEKESPKQKENIKELTQLYERAAFLFFSDKAQELYESALSVKSAEAEVSLMKLNEAFKLEPDNLKIDLQIRRIKLANGDCEPAASLFSSNRVSVKLIESVRLLYLQGVICKGDLADYWQQLNGSDFKNSSLQKFWLTLQLEAYYRAKRYDKSEMVFENIKSKDVNFPESYYWLWKIRTVQNLDATDLGMRYINLCKRLTSRDQRSFLFEPQLCSRTVELENAVKKIKGSDKK